MTAKFILEYCRNFYNSNGLEDDETSILKAVDMYLINLHPYYLTKDSKKIPKEMFNNLYPGRIQIRPKETNGPPGSGNQDYGSRTLSEKVSTAHKFILKVKKMKSFFKTVIPIPIVVFYHDEGEYSLRHLENGK
jgi:hypothetical protein